MAGGFRPMGGGADTDIATGLPKRQVMDRQERAAEARADQAIQEAAELTIELQSNPQQLRVIAEQYLKRLAALAAGDETCQALEAVLSTFNFKLAAAPRLRKRHLQTVLGSLQGFIQEP